MREDTRSDPDHRRADRQVGRQRARGGAYLIAGSLLVIRPVCLVLCWLRPRAQSPADFKPPAAPETTELAAPPSTPPTAPPMREPIDFCGDPGGVAGLCITPHVSNSRYIEHAKRETGGRQGGG